MSGQSPLLKNNTNRSNPLLTSSYRPTRHSLINALHSAHDYCYGALILFPETFSLDRLAAISSHCDDTEGLSNYYKAAYQRIRSLSLNLCRRLIEEDYCIDTVPFYKVCKRIVNSAEFQRRSFSK